MTDAPIQQGHIARDKSTHPRPAIQLGLPLTKVCPLFACNTSEKSYIYEGGQ